MELLKRKNIQFILDLMKTTKKGDLNYVYRGEFSQNISHHILSLAEKNIDKLGMPSKLKKRVFHIMVESIQNITRHQDAPESAPEATAIFGIQKKGPWYYVTTGNVLEKLKVPELREKLEKVNSLDQDELTRFYREILSDGKISIKGGAGLGLIEMARKSGNKLHYDFRNITEELAFFYLHSYISTARRLDNSDEEIDEPDPEYLSSFNYILDVHQFINQENILLIYSSVLDQDSLLSLIQILDSQMKDKLAFKKKIISNMVELLQNIIHHGIVTRQGTKESQGVFYISRFENQIHLNSINYIENKDISELEERLTHINSLTLDELEDLYNQKLFDFNSNTEGGLGFIEMRLKSKHKLVFEFIDDTSEFSHFLLKIVMDKN